MGHKSIFVKTADEADTVWARHRYCYLKNRHGLVKFCKNKIIRRERYFYKRELLNIDSVLL